MDMNAPLLMSDFLIDHVDDSLLTKDFHESPSMSIDDETEQPGKRDEAPADEDASHG